MISVIKKGKPPQKGPHTRHDFKQSYGTPDGRARTDSLMGEPVSDCKRGSVRGAGKFPERKSGDKRQEHVG